MLEETQIMNQALLSEAFGLWRKVVGAPSCMKDLTEIWSDFIKAVEDAMWDAAADIAHPWARIEEAWDPFDIRARRRAPHIRQVRRIIAESALLADPRVNVADNTVTVSVAVPHAGGTVLIPIARYNLENKGRWVFLYWFEAMILGAKESA